MILANSILSACRTAARRAFSLIEVMVAVTLMSVIVLGLLAMFSQTQRAFRAGVTQVDIMEGGRAACEMLSREIELATPTRLPNALNFFSRPNGLYVIQSLPGTSSAGGSQSRTNVYQEVAFTTRENQTWTGVRYSVLTRGNDIIGTLYRAETNASALDAPAVSTLAVGTFYAPTNRVVDGVVHFRVLAYDAYGSLITNNIGGSIGVTNNLVDGLVVEPNLGREQHFRDNALPAYVDVEIGILEAKTAERCRNLATPALQRNFLATKAGNVQIFRQRIPIRKVDPSVYQ